MCKTVKFCQVLVTYSSTYVLVSLSIDRFDAIKNPLNFARRCEFFQFTPCPTGYFPYHNTKFIQVTKYRFRKCCPSILYIKMQMNLIRFPFIWDSSGLQHQKELVYSSGSRGHSVHFSLYPQSTSTRFPSSKDVHNAGLPSILGSGKCTFHSSLPRSSSFQLSSLLPVTPLS